MSLFSAQILSWDAVLTMTNMDLEQISDPDINLFIEKGMRGGISYASKRYSKVNDKFYLNYDKEKQLKILFIYKILI